MRLREDQLFPLADIRLILPSERLLNDVRNYFATLIKHHSYKLSSELTDNSAACVNLSPVENSNQLNNMNVNEVSSQPLSVLRQASITDSCQCRGNNCEKCSAKADLQPTNLQPRHDLFNPYELMPSSQGYVNTKLNEFKIDKLSWMFLKRFHPLKIPDILNQIKYIVVNSHISGQEEFLFHFNDAYSSSVKTFEMELSQLKLNTSSATLTAFNTKEEIVAIYILSSIQNNVLITPKDNESSINNTYCITGETSDVKIARSRLTKLNFSYESYKSKSLQYNSSELNVYRPKESTIPLMISEPDKVVFLSTVVRPSKRDIIVTIKAGDLLQEDVAIIVNPTDKQLSLGGLVSQEILKKAGREIQRELENLLLVYQGGLRTADNVVTGGYKSGYKQIIHAIGPKTFNDYSSASEELIATFYNCLTRVDELELTSVAIPAMGSGIISKDLLITLNRCG